MREHTSYFIHLRGSRLMRISFEVCLHKLQKPAVFGSFRVRDARIAAQIDTSSSIGGGLGHPAFTRK